MYVQLHTKRLDPAEPITVLSFLPEAQFSCHTSGLQEGIYMWMFQFFTKEPASTDGQGRTKAPNTSAHAIKTQCHKDMLMT